MKHISKTDFFCFCVSRCAAVEISQTRPCRPEGQVIVSVPLCGQWRPFEGTGMVTKEELNAKSLSCLSLTDSFHLLSLSEPLHRGRLHLQRAAAGRWIHPFPFLTPWISCLSGVKTIPGPALSPLHSIPTTEEYAGRRECVWTSTKQSAIFQHGLWWSSWNGSKQYDQSSVLSR